MPRPSRASSFVIGSAAGRDTTPHTVTLRAVLPRWRQGERRRRIGQLRRPQARVHPLAPRRRTTRGVSGPGSAPRDLHTVVHARSAPGRLRRVAVDCVEDCGARPNAYAARSARACRPRRNGTRARAPREISVRLGATGLSSCRRMARLSSVAMRSQRSGVGRGDYRGAQFPMARVANVDRADGRRCALGVFDLRGQCRRVGRRSASTPSIARPAVRTCKTECERVVAAGSWLDHERRRHRELSSARRRPCPKESRGP